MNGKFLVIIIIFLLGVIGYQSGIMDTFFYKGKECSSSDTKKLANKIIIEQLLIPAFSPLVNENVIEYNIDNITFDTIITKKYNKNTGYHECSATTSIIGTFKFPHAKPSLTIKQVDTLFKYVFKSAFGVTNIRVSLLDNDKYKIIAPVWYTTEITDDKSQYQIFLKFNGD